MLNIKNIFADILNVNRTINSEHTKKIDLTEFVPDKVKVGKHGNSFPVSIKTDDCYIMLSYRTHAYSPSGSNAQREYSLTIPRYVNWSQETFEVLGLLQAEMGKTNNGCISFSNHEHRIITRVMRWFENELELNSDVWRWYIKVNINEPENEEYKKEVETKVIDYWTKKTRVDFEKRHPKTVSYIKNTKNKRLKVCDRGTLIIEHKSNLLSQIIKKYVNSMFFRMPGLGKDEIRGFMKGIIAGESCVEIDKIFKKYRVRISANDKRERDVYQACLRRLDIESKQYLNNKDLIISRFENNIELLKQKLMCLSHEKYSKFLNMMQLYPNVSEETGYFTGKREPHNKIPKEKIDKILDIYKSGGARTENIANSVGVSKIKVNRVLKENNLGYRLLKTSEEKRIEIAKFARENLGLTQKQMAEYLRVNESVVRRACAKYNSQY